MAETEKTQDLSIIDLEAKPTDAVVIISGPGSGEPLVEVLYNGDVKIYGDVNEAAKTFWNAVSLMMPHNIKIEE